MFKDSIGLEVTRTIEAPVMFRRVGQMHVQSSHVGKLAPAPTTVSVIILSLIVTVMFRGIEQVLVQSRDVGKLTLTHIAVRVIVVLLSQEPIGVSITIIAHIQDRRMESRVII